MKTRMQLIKKKETGDVMMTCMLAMFPVNMDADWIYSFFVIQCHSAKRESRLFRKPLRRVSSTIWDLDPMLMSLSLTVKRSRSSAIMLSPTSVASRKQGTISIIELLCSEWRVSMGFNRCFHFLTHIFLYPCHFCSYKYQRGTTEILKTSIRDLVDIKESVNIHTPEAMDIS